MDKCVTFTQLSSKTLYKVFLKYSLNKKKIKLIFAIHIWIDMNTWKIHMYFLLSRTNTQRKQELSISRCVFPLKKNKPFFFVIRVSVFNNVSWALKKINFTSMRGMFLLKKTPDPGNLFKSHLLFLKNSLWSLKCSHK